jgi:hypothetical protein
MCFSPFLVHTQTKATGIALLLKEELDGTVGSFVASQKQATLKSDA